VFLKLAWNEIFFRDFELFGFRVAGQLDHFHPVTQCGRDRLGIIRRANEHDGRQIERLVEIMVGKAEVLFRVEHLQQSTGRVAPEVIADFIQLVEHEHRIFTAAFAQLL
jgi:hypothetical protein